MKTLLVIAGLDPSGGAGFLADVRVAAEHGVRAVGVITAHTVQDTSGVRSVHPIQPHVLAEQLAVLLADVEIDAVKIGMLGEDRLVPGIVSALVATRAPIVWDPVLMPSRGGVPLLEGDLGAVLRELLPEVRLLTPNLAEAELLTAATAPIQDEAGMRTAAQILRRAGAAAVLVKGGHLPPESLAIDLLHDADAVHVYADERVSAGPTHGTGCVLSSAIACGLAEGQPLAEAVRGAKTYVHDKLRTPLLIGRGARCLI